jgi:ATP-binding cassette subfamily B protein
VDGTEIRDFELGALRKHIGVVLQDVFLFSNSIYHNITLGNPSISKEQVIEAAELVGARKFIERLPGGLDYNVMERGSTLSVGQRQLISFVRAMVYNPEILILDEATSSVDTETEETILNNLLDYCKDKTTIIVSHRVSSAKNADWIIDMGPEGGDGGGRIVAQGTPEMVTATAASHTGHYLGNVLSRRTRTQARSD